MAIAGERRGGQEEGCAIDFSEPLNEEFFQRV